MKNKVIERYETKIQERIMKDFDKETQERILNEERKRIKQLITDEILICRHEGTPTSRLTSLYNKI